MNQNQNLVCKNITVSGVDIKANSNGGGMVGNMANGTMLGYNILVDELSFARSSGTGDVTTWGYIAGTNADSPIKLAGFSRQGTIGVAATVGSYTTNMYGSGGYVVFADYNGTASMPNPNTEFSTLSGNNCINVGTGSPYRSKTIVTDYNIIVKVDNSGNISEYKDVVESSTTSYGAPVENESTTSEGYQIWYGSSIETDVTKLDVVETINSSATIDDLSGNNSGNGFYILTPQVRNGAYTNCLLTSTLSNNNGGYLKQNAKPNSTVNAAIWFFEKNDSNTKYKIYTMVNGARKYINVTSNYLIKFDDSGTEFDIVSSADALYNTSPPANCFEIIANSNRYLYYTNGNGQAFWFSNEHKQTDSNKWNALFKFYKVKYNTSWNCRDYSSAYSSSLSYNGNTVTSTGTPRTLDISSNTSKQTEYNDALAAYTLKTGNATDSSYAFIRITKTEIKNESIFTNAAPYVTTNPRFDITKREGTALQWLTGDGVSGTNYYGSAAYGMRHGSTNKTYQATGLTPSELATLETRLVNNMTTIKSASTADPSGYSGEDFPVLVINDIDTANAIINNYLKLLTNTEYDFYNGGVDPVYNVDISKWLYSSATGKFELQDGEAALKRSSEKFYITTSDIDNDKWQISLIDVQFYDPSDTSANKKIAYHVYVPVVVTKMLHYLVNIRAASTTSYTLDAYPTNVQNLIENLGNPITMKVTYTYRQTALEWADAINNGESVYRNYEKTLTVKATDNLFPDDAIIVLVDPNDNRDKYYTSGFGSGQDGILTAPDSTHKYELRLRDFTDFDVVKLNDLMNITATAGSGNLVEWNSSTDSETDIVCVVRNGKTVDGEPTDLPLRYKNSTDNESTTYYTVSVSLKDYQKNSGYVQENYYLSIFTKENKSDTSIYHYEVSSAANETFGDSNHPSARIGGNAEAPHLFLGNLYTNDVTLAEQNSNRKMDSSNNYLEAELQTNIGFTQAAKDGGILDKIRNDNVKIYQTFMVSLNRLNGSSGNERGILVDPINIEYNDYTIGGSEPSNYHRLSYKKHNEYIELLNECDIKSYLIAGAERAQPAGETHDYTVEISETVKLTYAAGSLPEQFPKSTAESTDVGTKMIGYSNISSTKDGGAASRASNNTDGRLNPLLYYIENDTSATFSYNVIANSLFDGDGNGNFGQLGVDGYELDESVASDANKYVQIKTAGLYDAHEYSLNSDAHYVKVSVKLSKKSAYGTSLDIPTYLSDFRILDKDGDVIRQTADDPATEEVDESITVTTDSTDPNVVVYIVPKELLESSENIFTIPINFKVWSGDSDNFEDKDGTHTDPNDDSSPVYDMEYSNYKVLVTVGLLNTNSASETPLNNSDKSDHIIYTNAKLYSEVITS